MFYSQFILAKKGPLGTIWIAAHLERKLRKNQVADTDIGVSVDSILFPDVPIALRLSSHLLLGVVRIYSKKVGYLFDDCSDALLKVKQAFRSTAVDLPPEESTAPYHSITLPETFDLDDFELPPDTARFFLQPDFVDRHLSSTDQITLQDPPTTLFRTSQFGLDERFGDDGDTSRLDLIDPLENSDTTGHAQAPSTPVMAEEPNLTSAQEVSVCDDHQELEEEPHFHAALASKDHQDSEDCSTTKLPTAESSDLYSGRANLPIDVNLAAVSDDQKTNHLNSMSDLLSPAWNPFSEDQEAMSPAFEYPGGSLASLDGVNGKLQYEVTNDDDQQATEQFGGPKTIEIDQLSLEPQHSNGVDHVENLGKSCHLSDSLPSNVESPRKSYLGNAEIRATEEWDDPKISSSVVHENLEVASTHVLHPCKHLNQPSVTSPESNAPVEPHLQSGVPEIYAEVAASERNEESRLPGWSLEFQGNQSEFCNLNDQHYNVITVEPQLDIPSANEISDLPAPEKLLSLPRSPEKDQIHLLESTPNGEHLVIGNVDDTGTNIISGKKRTFTESTLTVDSVNSIDTLGVVQSKRTKESVPDDNDLLSSILVGRASFLKLKPTPPPQRTSRKRPRSTTRIGSSKRKVVVDDTMVLNGDQIRQQLTHTGDIRRIRKKAPCTRAEIWMIRKEYLIEEIFTEPIFTGVSSGLASIYNQAYDLSDIKLSQNETQIKIQEAICNDMSVYADTNLDKETEKEVNHESILARKDMELQSPERQEDKTSSENLPHGRFEEMLEMRINEKIDSTADAINPTIVNEVDLTFSIDPASVDKVDGPTGFVDLSNSVQFDSSEPMPNQKFETQFVEAEVSMVDTSSEKVVDATFGGMDLRASDECQLEGAEVDFSVANRANVMNGKESEDSFLVTYPNEGMEGVSKNELGVVKEVRNLEFEVDGAYPIVDDLDIHPAEEATAHHVKYLNSDAKGASVCDNEHPGCGNLDFQKEMDPENAFVDYNAPIDHADFEYGMDEHDTGFLNEDDDEIAEEGEDCAPSADHVGFIDNSGWSSRTRAVAKYLQVLFDKETEQGRKALPMNNLLIGKTRKEASRMFFEALVLKTRDYIHLEQEASFGNINMKPGVKLMKADF